MSILAKVMHVAVCDGCGDLFDPHEEGVLYVNTHAEALADVEGRIAEGYDDDWTGDGEGKHHCPSCPPLKLTDEAIAQRARALTSSDVPLDIPE